MITVLLVGAVSGGAAAALAGIWAYLKVISDFPAGTPTVPRLVRESPPAILFRPDLLSRDGRRAYRVLIACVIVILAIILSLMSVVTRVRPLE